MSLRVWLPYFIIFILTFLLFIFAWGFQPTQPSIAEQYCSNTKPTITKEYSLTSNADGSPIIQVREHQSTEECEDAPENKSQQREALSLAEADLLFQERMAYWTFCIGMFTAIGLGTLFLTLWETREVTKETRRIGDAQTRAYLSITGGKFIFSPNDYSALKIIAEVHNSGNSPALEIELVASLTIDYVDEGPIVETLGISLDTLRINDIGGQVTLPKEAQIRGDLIKSIDAILHKDGEILLYGLVIYKDVFGNTRQQDFAISGVMNDSKTNKKGFIINQLSPCHPKRALYEGRTC